MKIAIGFAARFALAAFGCAAMPPAAHATDGVIEINQAKIDAGGTHTFVINQPGSYRLTSNLTQFNKDTNVIVIYASNVTIDLNGFVITGANQCTFNSGPPPSLSCSGNGVGYGINSLGASGITVSNGTIKGMGNACVYLSGSGMRLENLDVSHCGNFGVRIIGGVVNRVTSEHNYGHGLDVTAVVADSVARYNGQEGIYCYGTVRNSVATNNVWSGIYSNLGIVEGSSTIQNGQHGIVCNECSIVGSIASMNAQEGLKIYGRATISGSMVTLNNGGNLNAQVDSAGAFLLYGTDSVCGDHACP